ncbi:MAG: DHH family phosphoesterase [Sarcina sp.]
MKYINDKSKNIVNEIILKIKKYDEIILFRHVFPDPDSYGAQIGLKSIIENTFPNKKVCVVGENSERLSYIGTMDKEKIEISSNSLAIVLDVSNKERIDNQNFKDAGFIIKIDHHEPFSEKFENLTWVDTEYKSCSEMILDLYLDNREVFKICDFGIKALYSGIVGDTGRFLYLENPTMLFKKLSEVEFNFNAKDIYMNMYKRSKAELKYLGYVYENFEETQNGVAYLKIPYEVVKKFAFRPIDVARRVNALADTENVYNWLFFAEDENGEVLSEFRSNGPIVNEIAFKFGGGGHALAAGAKLKNWEVVNEIIKEFDLNCKTQLKSKGKE